MRRIYYYANFSWPACVVILWCDLICVAQVFLCVLVVFSVLKFFHLHYLLCFCLNKIKIQIYFYIVYFIVRFYRTLFIDRSAASSQPFCLFIFMSGILPRGVCLVYYPMSGVSTSPSHHVVLFPAVYWPMSGSLFLCLYYSTYVFIHVLWGSRDCFACLVSTILSYSDRW